MSHKEKLLETAREVLVVAEGGAGIKAGMTIGSGAIESVHKWVVQARCKQAGMAWSELWHQRDVAPLLRMGLWALG